MAENKIKYSIVIPTYNHLDDCLRPCLESIIKYTDLDNVEVIVIANGCRDSTVPYVNSLGKPFKCIEHKEQLGYTKATNIGMRVACGDYIILLNNDTVFLPQQKNEWLAILEKPFLIDPQAGMSGPMLFKGVPGKSNDFIMFFCAMTTRKVVDNIGYLDEMYSPGGVEDVDYGLRLTIGGYKLYSVATSRCVEAKDAHHMSFGSFPIYHPGGTTCSKEPGWNDILIRNNRLLAQKFPEYFTGLDWINELEKQTKRKIYDCFPFFNEFEILEIRLAELYDIVDKFIIIEASKTHSGRDKPLYLRENIAKFAKYQDKIVIHTVDFPANLQDAWSRERSQRDAIMDILRPIMNDNDFAIISDCDEIPKVSAIQKFIANNTYKVGILQQKRYMYYLNNENVSTDEPQLNARIVSCKLLKDYKNTPCAVRYCDKYDVMPFEYIDDGGWHFTFMGGAEKVIEKIKSFAHTEYDRSAKTEKNTVLQNIENSKDVYDCKSSWKFVDIDSTFPKQVLQNVEKYIQLGFIKKQHRIIDCFTFYNELDMLDLRLNELNDVVDKFVICEAKYTHQGNPKPLYFKDNFQRYKEFAHKICHIVVEYFPSCSDANIQHWANEAYQRDRLADGLQDCNDDDIIIISDVDEIPNKQKIQDCKTAKCLSQTLYIYNFNLQSDIEWCHAKIVPYHELRDKYNLQMSFLRNFVVLESIKNAGWHLSYFGDVDYIYQKLQAFAHVELKAKSKVEIANAILKGETFWQLDGHSRSLNRIISNVNIPNVAITNKEKYKEFFAMDNLVEIYQKANPNLFEEIYKIDVYNMKPEEYSGCVVVDIGANIGVYAKRAVDLGASVVHCFEPERNNFVKLCSYLRDEQNIKKYNLAVADIDTKFVNLTPEDTSANIYGATSLDMSSAVPCITLQNIIDLLNEQRLVLKIDCEGAEFDILMNIEYAHMRNVEILLLEIHDRMNPKYIDRSKDLIDRMKEFGFTIVYQAPQWGVWYDNGTFIPSPIYCYKMKRVNL